MGIGGYEIMKRDVYVFNNGTLVRKDNTLLLTIDEKKHYIPVETVESIHFFGEVDVNKACWNLQHSMKFFYIIIIIMITISEHIIPENI